MKKDIIRIGRYRLRTIHAHCLTWYQRTFGNPYFAMIVTVNQGYPSEQTFVVPMQYGIPHYQYVTSEVIQRFGIKDPDNILRQCPTFYGVRVYTYATPVKYRDIIKLK